MNEVDTSNLNPISVYYRIEAGSKAESILDTFIKKMSDVQAEMHRIGHEIKPIPEAEPLMRGGSIFAFAIPQELPIPECYRKARARSREDSTFNGMTVIYPNLKKAGGTSVLDAINKVPKMPETSELIRDFGFGYEGFLLIGNRLFRALGFFRKPEVGGYVEANAFIAPCGRFYHGATKSLVDKLPLADGLVEIKATEFFGARGRE